jgi:hypothetical protein
MNKLKIISAVFITAAIILSDIMCANVAFEYCNMLWGIKYAGYSAPVNAAFLIAVPYIVGILICIILSNVFWRKSIIKQ